MKHLKAVIYNVCKTLRGMKLLPWFIWSPVYDRCHKDAVKWERSKT